MTSPQPMPVRRLRLVVLLTVLAVPGVLSLLPSILTALKDMPAGSPPVPVMAAITSLQTLIMVALAATAGAWFAPKLGFEAPIITGRRPLSSLGGLAPFAISVGAGAGLVMVALEGLLFRPFVPEQIYMLAVKPAAVELIPSLLYGGILEEILLRWGFMTLITWVLYRIFRGGTGQVPSPVTWIGIVGAALVFGLLHLPAVSAAVGDLSLPLLLRTIVLNGIPGVLFGWLFTRRGLESAMLAHMGAHLGMFLLRILIAG